MDNIDIAAATLTFINYFVLVPTMIYCLYLFHKHRKHDMIKFRHPYLVYIMNIITISALLTERIFILSVQAWNIIDAEVWILYFVFSIFWWPTFCLFCIQVYHMYYQQRYNISIAESSWKKDINPEEHDWYISHKQTWGNTQWLIKLGAVAYVLACTSDAVFSIIFGDSLVTDLLNFVVLSIPVCLSFGILYKARQIRDVFRIRDQILCQAVIFALGITGYTICFMITTFHEALINKWPKDIIRFEWTLYVFLMDFGSVAFTYGTTAVPVYLIKKQTLETLLYEEQSANDNVHNIRRNIDEIFNTDLQSMNRFVANYETFKLFMTHLVSEFCAESLLFLVELIQCKHGYQKRNKYTVLIPRIIGDKDEYEIIDFNINPLNGKPYKTEKEKYFTYLFNSDGSIMTKLALPLQITKSMILTKHPNDLWAQMQCLYNKYVKTDSNFELNISYEVHAKLDEIFGGDDNEQKLSEQAVFNVMDECAITISVLLRNAFSRFVKSDRFDLALGEIKKNEHSIYGDDNSKLSDNVVVQNSDIKMKQLFNSGTIVVVSAPATKNNAA